MAYTNPTTVTTGALYSATQHNRDVVDNIIALYAGTSGSVYSAVTHSDANFKGDAVDANWVVAAGDHQTFRFKFNGKQIHVQLSIITSTVANTPAVLTVVVPGGIPSAYATGGAFYYNENGTAGIGRWYVSAGGAVISFSKVTGAWANSTDLLTVQADMTFEVQ